MRAKDERTQEMPNSGQIIMSLPTLNATLRAATGKGPNRRLRAAGQVPGVIYGNGKEPTALCLDPKAVVNLLGGPLGRNSLAQINIDGDERMAIVQDYQVHPWKRKLIHIDFLEITPTTTLTLKVPFKRVGQSPMEKLGAKVEQHREVLKVRCTPANIPQSIDYDMTPITEEFAEVMASEITLPEGVEFRFDKDFKLIRLKLSAAPLEDEEGAGGAGGEDGEDGETKDKE
jgi:large subunit ribosomal protein L25